MSQCKLDQPLKYLEKENRKFLIKQHFIHSLEQVKKSTYFAVRPRQACDPSSLNGQSEPFETVIACQTQLYRYHTR